MEKEKIFISYSRKDKEKVFLFRDEIENKTNQKCWIDLNGIESDQQFVDVIINAIKETDIFLFMYSKNSAVSEWTRKELDFAKYHKKRIVFINIDQSQLEDWFQFNYGGQDIIDYSNSDQKQKLILNIVKWCDFDVSTNVEVTKQLRYNSSSDNDFSDQFAKAEEYDDADEEEKALDIYIMLANKGHAGAQERLGTYYEMGFAGLKKNYDKAIEWYLKSAKQGNGEAMNSLGDLYRYCDDSNFRNEKESIEWYKKAINAGWYEGYLSIGHCYKDGFFFEQNYQKAYDNYILSLNFVKTDEDKGIIYAVLGYLCAELEQYDKALSYWLKSHDCGWTKYSPELMLQIGSYFYLGLGCEVDYNSAFYFISESFKKENYQASSWMGRCYMYGKGVEEDIGKAISYFEIGIEHNDIESMDYLADYLWDNGNSTSEEDINRAFELYSKAADAGNSSAMESLSYFYDEGGPLEDRDLLKDALQRIIDNGDDFEVEVAQNRIKRNGFV